MLAAVNRYRMCVRRQEVQISLYSLHSARVQRGACLVPAQCIWKQASQRRDMAIALNQSLTPTKLSSETPLSPSNYPDKRSMVAAYKRMVGTRSHACLRIVVILHTCTLRDSAVRATYGSSWVIKLICWLCFVVIRLLQFALCKATERGRSWRVGA